MAQSSGSCHKHVSRAHIAVDNTIAMKVRQRAKLRAKLISDEASDAAAGSLPLRRAAGDVGSERASIALRRAWCSEHCSQVTI